MGTRADRSTIEAKSIIMQIYKLICITLAQINCRRRHRYRRVHVIKRAPVAVAAQQRCIEKAPRRLRRSKIVCLFS